MPSTIDPAMLDCAGQLVAFWLLEHEGRTPSFGIFPFAARRVVIGRPPLPPGTMLRARCAVTRHDTITDATCVFETADGEVVAALEGFLQRLIPFPDPLVRAIFGGERIANISAVAETIRTSSPPAGGYWERAMAHLSLSPDDLARWHAIPAAQGARLRWLLEHL